ncbi:MULTISPECIES: HNH endonuclease [Pseudomonas syringae group]|uniref:HNH endonuclease n=1 Tax=Pseudomonas syringae group TaxID=136849 RepID=UPI0011C40415|nr:MULTISPECIES: HNH endonuclease [Pseudomonas syringae group]
MRRIPFPTINTRQTFAACTSTMRDDDCLARMQDIADEVIRRGGFYDAHARAGVMYAIPEHRPVSGPLVIGKVTKSELISLYDAGMVERRPGRAIYNAIIVSASFCPSCGNTGNPKTLDHYLPKANYPWLSICPYNLLPACRDCNTEKGNPVPKSAFQQLIHPYYDDDCFFDEIWVCAKIIWTSCFELRFYANPPEYWWPLDKERAIHHFSFYDISDKYSLLAAEELSIIIDLRKGVFRNVSPIEFQAYLNGVGCSVELFPNHWKGVMYRALARDVDFVTHLF